MNVIHVSLGVTFEWDSHKAQLNLSKHGVSFAEACQVFFDIMKIDKLKQRLRKDRPVVTISIRMPEDVVDDLKSIAPQLGFTGYQPLMRAYIGQGLRTDLERLEGSVEVSGLIDSLRKRGIEAEVIAEAIAEAQGIGEAA